MLAERDSPPDYVLIALSDEIIARCGTAEYTTQEEGRVHRDLRRALKALAMRYRIPTQLLREATSGGRDQTTPSRIAWNFFTGMYCKAGGYPWSPYGLGHGTCYVGIGFYRPLGSRFPRCRRASSRRLTSTAKGWSCAGKTSTGTR